MVIRLRRLVATFLRYLSARFGDGNAGGRTYIGDKLLRLVPPAAKSELAGSVLSVDSFTVSGMWKKPAGATAFEIVVVGGSGGTSADGHPGQPGQAVNGILPACDLPDEMPITVGQGGAGWPSGDDGYVIITAYGP